MILPDIILFELLNQNQEQEKLMESKLEFLKLMLKIMIKSEFI